MAEAVGLAGSIISIVAVASRIVEGLIKLKDFVDAVSDAPDDLVYSLKELERLALVVQDFDRDFPPDAGTAGIEIHRQNCLKSCQQARQDLEDVFKELENRIGKKRILGSIRMVLKTPTINKIKERLKDAQMALLMSNSIYFEAVREQRNQQMFQIVQQTHLIVQEIRSNAPHQEHTQTITTRAISRTTNQYRQLDRSATQQSGWKKTYSFQFPQFLRLPIHCFEFTAWTNSYRPGWYLPDRSYQILSDGAPVLKCIRKGDLGGLRALLRNQHASLYDVVPVYDSLMSLAINSKQFNICDFLLESGYNPDFTRNQFRKDKHHIVDLVNDLIWVESEQCDGRFTTIMKRILDDTSWNGPDEDENSFLLVRKFEAMQLITERYSVAYEKLNIETCYRHIFELRKSVGRDFFSMTKFILKDKILDSNILDRSHNQFGTLLHCIAYYIPYRQHYNYGDFDYENELQEYETYIGDLIHAGTHLNAIIPTNGRTPIMELAKGACDALIIMGTWENFNDALRSIIMKWLQILIQCGVDLVRYGKREKRIHDSRMKHLDFRYYDFQSHEYSIVHLINFTCGPEPEDWQFCFVPVMKDWCMEFWDMVDHPERSMPGAWEWEPIDVTDYRVDESSDDE